MNEVEIYPDDPKMELGEYEVLMVNRDDHIDDYEFQPLAVCLKLTSVPKIVDLT